MCVCVCVSTQSRKEHEDCEETWGDVYIDVKILCVIVSTMQTRTPPAPHWKSIQNENCQNGKSIDNFLSLFFPSEVDVSTVFQKLLKRCMLSGSKANMRVGMLQTLQSKCFLSTWGRS